MARATFNTLLFDLVTRQREKETANRRPVTLKWTSRRRQNQFQMTLSYPEQDSKILSLIHVVADDVFLSFLVRMVDAPGRYGNGLDALARTLDKDRIADLLAAGEKQPGPV